MRSSARACSVVLIALAVALSLASSASATSGTMIVVTDTTLTEDHQGDIVIAADNITLDARATWSAARETVLV